MYCVIDYYEGLEVLGYNITQMAYAEDLAQRREDETDGECCIRILKQKLFMPNRFNILYLMEDERSSL